MINRYIFIIWIINVWESNYPTKSQIINQFAFCGISNKFDGEEDDLFKELIN